MNSALHKKAPTATISFVTSKIKARKNDTVEYYLEQMDKERKRQLIRFAVKQGQRQREQKRLKQSQVYEELSRRIAAKRQQKEIKQREQLEKKL